MLIDLIMISLLHKLSFILGIYWSEYLAYKHVLFYEAKEENRFINFESKQQLFIINKNIII